MLVAVQPDGSERPIEPNALHRLLTLGRELVRRRPWSPLPGPQTDALNSAADIIGYGGAAGGGKTDLACGLALTEHRKVMILRRVGTEMQGILDRLEEIVGNKDGFNGQLKVWKRQRPDGVKQQLEFASLPNAGDERGFQGRPHDLIVFDEAANFLESQVRFLLGWLRSTIKDQRKRALLTFNPPTSAEGQWVIAFFAPWLDKRHPNPAKPGELRWFATIAGKDIEVPDSRPFVADALGGRNYYFNPNDYWGTNATQIIRPMSRTFIPSRITDNPYLLGTGYMAMLQALPEPLRSQMLNGDFQAGMVDDEWQVIPTAWVEAAMARWKLPDVLAEMDSLGVDVARGGDDETVIFARHANWIAEPKAYPGASTPDGHAVATFALMAQKDRAPIHVDVIGVGASPYDLLRERAQTIAVNVSERATATDKTGTLTFPNQRSQFWWQLREALDPENNRGLALPNNSRLLADLTAPKWKLQGRMISVESRDDIKARIGRSPDYASALILAMQETPKIHVVRGARSGGKKREYDPYANG